MTDGFLDMKTEYTSLREELLQYRRYIFERPLLIVGAGIALSRADTSLVVMPPLVAVLLTFNFWFTVNRLRSSARIVAYIQSALEGTGMSVDRLGEFAATLPPVGLRHATEQEGDARPRR
jgi:hypothetical protein